MFLFLFLISLQDTCVNGEACGLHRFDGVDSVCACVRVCAFRIPITMSFPATVLSLVLFFIVSLISCLLLD